jgi:heavy metal sensor kinase
MKSIRLSMTVYFLGLLVLALSAASWLVYETAHATLLDKQRTTEQLIETQYKERCRDEEKRRDEQLLREAQTFNKLIQFDRIIRGRDLNVLNVAGLLASEGTRMPYESLLWGANIGGWPRSDRDLYRADRAGDVYRRYYEEVFRRVPAIQFNEEEWMHDPENHIAKYFQIDIDWRQDWRSSYSSHSLGDEPLPDDPAAKFEKDNPLAWKWDEAELTAGVKVRRVVLKTPWTRFSWAPRPARAGPPTPPPIGTPPLPAPPAGPPLYIQCAYDVADRDKALHIFAARRDEELQALKTETEESLNKLRTRLFLMSAVTFAATVAGTWFLVWLGLRPLRRLSDAVSRVSEKDFRLQFKEPRLPAELRPIVERLTSTLEQLARAFAREKQATADISHELRTPLAALLTTTELALRKPRSAEEYREMLEDCRLSGQQMNRAVERLLALARLDAGVDTMRPERVDVSILAEQCAALVRPLAEARGLQLRVYGGDGAQLLADPDKLREVITNLLHNAIEYNRPQGSIDVSVARQNGHLHVEVRDTGIGIKPEAKEHIFERFYRADSSRGGDDGLHAGLGLAIVKGYVDLMGGTIHVESAEGQGSTFHLELPAGT